ncbi:unnamed protein product [Amoebophrya sp. A120]|nr:unnamed protein product [Amoebophrya sp. A120]|eukprot:GSA120T00019269001.1
MAQLNPYTPEIEQFFKALFSFVCSLDLSCLGTKLLSLIFQSVFLNSTFRHNLKAWTVFRLFQFVVF